MLAVRTACGQRQTEGQQRVQDPTRASIGHGLHLSLRFVEC